MKINYKWFFNGFQRKAAMKSLCAGFLLLILSAPSPAQDAQTALQLNGTTQLAYALATDDFNFAGSFTLEAWVKVNEFTEDWQSMITKGDDSWRLHRYSNTNVISFGTNHDPGNVANDLPGTTNVNDGQWHHIAAVYDGSTKYLYVDGSLDTLISVSGSLHTNSFLMNVGANSQMSGRNWSGAFDEMRVWTTARTAAEIRDNIYRSLSGNETGLLSYWRFDEGAGTNVKDLAGSNDLLTFSSPSWENSGIPLSIGVSKSSGEFTSGVADLGTVTLTTSDAFDDNVRLTATRLSSLPFEPPVGSALVFNKYWVVQSFGNAGSFAGDLAFTVHRAFADGIGASSFTLYRRSANGAGSWQVAKNGASNVTLTSSTSTSLGEAVISFAGIDTLGQFAIGTDASTALLFNNSYVTKNAFVLEGSRYGVVEGSERKYNFTGPFSVEAWIKVDEFTKDWAGIVTNGNHSWRLQRAGNTNFIDFGTTGLSNQDLIGNTNVNDGQWHHLAAVYDGSAKYLYVDGELDTSVAVTGTLSPAPQGDRVAIGGNSSSDALFTYFKGMIDEVRVWTVARTATQVRENMHTHLNGKEIGMYSYWKFSGMSMDHDDFLIYTFTSFDDAGNHSMSMTFSSPDSIPPTPLATANIPFGSGVSESFSNFTSGAVSLPDLALTTVDAFDQPVDIMGTLISSSPNVVPNFSNGGFTDRYWVVHAFGSPGSFSGDLAFTVPSSLTEGGSARPEGFVLYRRNATSEGDWTKVADRASSVGAATLTFEGISSLGQFAIGPFIFPDSSRGYCASLGGTQYFNVGNHEDFNFTGPFSIEAWIKVSSFDVDWQAVVTKGDNSWRLHRSSNTNVLGFGTSGLSNVNLGGTTNINDGNWHHVAAVYDGSTKYLYVDGRLDTSIAVTGTLSTDASSLFIGENSGMTGRRFKGKIDEVRIWSSARTSTQIREFMNRSLEGHDSGLVSYWQFNAGTGNVTDPINFHTGMANNDPPYAGSTIPFGPGSSASVPAIVIANAIDFGTLALTTTDGFDAETDMTVTQIMGSPNIVPMEMVTFLRDRYWVTGAYGTPGTFSANMTFVVPQSFTQEGAGDLSSYTLYRRALNADGPWSAVITGAESLTSDAITFNGITSFGQFMIGGPFMEPDSLAGNALSLGGASQHVNSGNSADLNFTSSFTIEAWIKVGSFDTQWQTIISKGNNAWRIHRSSNSNTIAFGTSGLSNEDLTGSTNVNDGQWHHVAAVYDGSTKFLYIDGDLDASTPVSGTLSQSTAEVFIGNNSEQPSRGFNGTIDEVRLWDVARTETQIRQRMHLTLTGFESGIVAYWQFNEASGTAGDWTQAYPATFEDGASRSVSSVPVGKGFSATGTEVAFVNSLPIGAIVFTTTDPFDSGVELTVTQINTAPNSLPAALTTLSDRYWIVDLKGTPGTFAVNMTFTLPDGYLQPSDGANLVLFKRGANADSAWGSFVVGASNVTATTVTFDGVDSFSQFTIGSSGSSPLPVQISAFTASANRLNAELKWRTEAETENYGFEVERRAVSMEYGVGSREKEGKDESPPTCPPSFWRKADQPLAETNQRNDSPFTIHHSPWATVGLVQGSGTSTSAKDYSFVDKPNQPGRYAYRIKQIDHSGSFVYTDAVELEVGLAPLEFNLAQNYPNPFNPTTTIEFTLPQDGRVVLKIYDLQGQEVATLVDEERKAGVYHKVIFDASRMASGVYFTRLHYGNQHLLKKILLVK